MSQPAGRRPTIVDVARRAGVSAGTVSRAIAGTYPVAAATKERIDAAIHELGYVANMNARALVGTAARPIALVMTDVTDPYFSYIAREVEKAASERGRLCILASSRGSASRELAVVELMRQQQAEVIVLVGGIADDADSRAELAAVSRAMAAEGATVVVIGRSAPPGVLEVSYDAEAAAHLIAAHVLALGHRQVLYLGGPPDLPTSRLRLAGVRRALAEVGLDLPDARIRQGRFGRQPGYDGVADAVASGLAFTAVICANEPLAAGALTALAEAGVSVPHEVSVTGFDDLPLATDVTPRLTTVHVPVQSMGAEAVARALDGPRPDAPILFDVTLVVRDSTAPVRVRG